MKTSIVVLVALLVVVYASKQPKLSGDAHRLFADFCATYNRTYATSDEADNRYKTFKHNLKVIDDLNEQHDSATFGINKFSDLSSKEFAGMYKMPNFKPAYSNAKYQPVAVGDALPDSYDWRDKNAVTPVKDQAQCGSCWAFSTVEEIESQWILKGNAAVELAPQQIVDCDTKDGGCNGGDTPTAYEYVIKAGGLEKESVYPYHAKNGKCQFEAKDVAVKISSWKYVVKSKNESEMQNALYNDGPLSICVDAEPWQSYQSGIITKSCGQKLDHCVQLVGYGVEGTTQFWSVRNSWAADWGEKGYIRIERNKNLCGIANEVTVAVI